MTTLIQCPSCGKNMSSALVDCPHCHETRPHEAKCALCTNKVLNTQAKQWRRESHQKTYYFHPECHEIFVKSHSCVDCNGIFPSASNIQDDMHGSITERACPHCGHVNTAVQCGVCDLPVFYDIFQDIKHIGRSNSYLRYFSNGVITSSKESVHYGPKDGAYHDVCFAALDEECQVAVFRELKSRLSRMECLVCGSRLPALDILRGKICHNDCNAHSTYIVKKAGYCLLCWNSLEDKTASGIFKKIEYKLQSEGLVGFRYEGDVIHPECLMRLRNSKL